MLTTVNMVKEPDEELIQDTFITSSKVLENPKDEIKWEKCKSYKRRRKANN